MRMIHILHPSYYPKIKGNILKNKRNNKCFRIYTINHNENEDEHLVLDMGTIITNIERVST